MPSMPQLIRLLIATIALRPYVFVFFACYLFLAITHIGWKRTALFTMLAYAVAFVCEWSSAVAATGFPFGLYYYIQTTRDSELWIAGVPFMDSLSFTFLSYVSWEVAVIVVGWLRTTWRGERADDRGLVRRIWPTTLWASFLMMCLDIIIDPVALRGDRWFLGRLYYYPHGGIYFGVTIANFLGWFFVCCVILRLFVWLETVCFKGEPRSQSTAGVLRYRHQALGPAGLYFGVLGFNLFMTFWIGEMMLGAVGLFIALPLAVLVMLALSRGLRAEAASPNGY